jgi:hypothetical protein
MELDLEVLVVVRKWMVLGAVAGAALAGCGETEETPSMRSAPGGVAPARATISQPRGSVAPVNTEPLATVKGSARRTELDLIGVQRRANTVEARLRLRKSSTLFDPTVLSADGETSDLSGARLVDPVNLRTHLPLRDPDGQCVCTHITGGQYYSGRSIDLSVQFAAPPADVHEVSVSLPTFASFDGVRIG